jgi:hemolysin activation/secretion protein
LQVYGFGDGGAVWQHNVASVAEENERLASAGVGFRFNLGSHLSGNVEVAKPLLKNIQSQGDRGPRVFFDLASRF